MATTKEKLVFSLIMSFFPKPFQKTSTGGRDAPLFGYMEIPPTPKPLPVCEESHCGPNTVLILLLRGVGVWRDKSIFSSALLN